MFDRDAPMNWRPQFQTCSIITDSSPREAKPRARMRESGFLSKAWSIAIWSCYANLLDQKGPRRRHTVFRVPVNAVLKMGVESDMRDEMTATLNIYKWPSQAFWRYFELQALKQIEYERPILEIGCGDGQFSSLVFREIDEAIDVNPRSVEKCRRLANHLYRRVQCLDARELQFSEGGYGTIYANCVMEHMPDIEGVLAGCYRGLRPGGKLVMTVPLTQMN